MSSILHEAFLELNILFQALYLWVIIISEPIVTITQCTITLFHLEISDNLINQYFSTVLLCTLTTFARSQSTQTTINKWCQNLCIRLTLTRVQHSHLISDIHRELDIFISSSSCNMIISNHSKSVKLCRIFNYSIKIIVVTIREILTLTLQQIMLALQVCSISLVCIHDMLTFVTICHTHSTLLLHHRFNNGFISFKSHNSSIATITIGTHILTDLLCMTRISFLFHLLCNIFPSIHLWHTCVESDINFTHIIAYLLYSNLGTFSSQTTVRL